MTDYDPRLVDLYDGDNPDGPDHEFYRALADELAADSILDLGCGTGLLTVSFVRPGRTVVGVDPSPSMLAFARRRAGAEGVRWVSGDSRAIPVERLDFAVMTGNVAQHIPDGDWPRTLRNLRGALRTGGILAFESRNPVARAWENWNSDERTTRDTAHGPLVEWMEAQETNPGTVTLRAHNLFAGAGETVTESLVLRFRSRTEIERELRSAGFEIDNVFGDWDRQPASENSPLLIFVARAEQA